MRVQEYSICDVFEGARLCLIKTVDYLTKLLHKIYIGKMWEELFWANGFSAHTPFIAAFNSRSCETIFLFCLYIYLYIFR